MSITTIILSSILIILVSLYISLYNENNLNKNKLLEISKVSNYTGEYGVLHIGYSSKNFSVRFKKISESKSVGGDICYTLYGTKVKIKKCYSFEREDILEYYSGEFNISDKPPGGTIYWDTDNNSKVRDEIINRILEKEKE